MRLRTLVPFLLLLSACGTEPSEDPSFLRILTDGSYYMQSDPMYIALTNVSAYRLRFQPNFVLQHLTSSGWQPTGMGSGSSTWIILSPGQRYIQSWGLNASTPMGTARLEYLQTRLHLHSRESLLESARTGLPKQSSCNNLRAGNLRGPSLYSPPSSTKPRSCTHLNERQT